MDRKCSSLVEGDKVVFTSRQEKTEFDGDVIWTDPKYRCVHVIYLQGPKCYNEAISYDDMLGVYNPNGDYMRFGHICGSCDKLIPE